MNDVLRKENKLIREALLISAEKEAAIMPQNPKTPKPQNPKGKMCIKEES